MSVYWKIMALVEYFRVYHLLLVSTDPLKHIVVLLYKQLQNSWDTCPYCKKKIHIISKPLSIFYLVHIKSLSTMLKFRQHWSGRERAHKVSMCKMSKMMLSTSEFVSSLWNWVYSWHLYWAKFTIYSCKSTYVCFLPLLETHTCRCTMWHNPFLLAPTGVVCLWTV